MALLVAVSMGRSATRADEGEEQLIAEGRRARRQAAAQGAANADDEDENGVEVLTRL